MITELGEYTTIYYLTQTQQCVCACIVGQYVAGLDNAMEINGIVKQIKR